MMGYYSVSQICLNGHAINYCTRERPQDNMEFCDKCGAKTIINCPKCDSPIQGKYILDEYEEYDVDLYYRNPSVHAYCHNCGNPYPWTEEKLKVTKESVEELEGLNGEEKKILNQSLDDIIADTPRTELSANRINKLLKKATGTTVQTVRNLVVDIASETAVKFLKEL